MHSDPSYAGPTGAALRTTTRGDVSRPDDADGRGSDGLHDRHGGGGPGTHGAAATHEGLRDEADLLDVGDDGHAHVEEDLRRGEATRRGQERDHHQRRTPSKRSV